MIADLIDRFLHNVNSAPGHSHLYGDFDFIIDRIVAYRNGGGLTRLTADRILAAVACLTDENMFGGRPNTGMWETYFSKCMTNAHRLLKEYTCFDGYMSFCPAGYCNKFLDAFRYMYDNWKRADEYYPEWCFHFESMASLSAEMFYLTADSSAHINEDLLDCPEDEVFTWLISGFSKSASPEADRILQMYVADEEAWVRQLAQKLVDEREERLRRHR